jgi:hypothetical protein
MRGVPPPSRVMSWHVLPGPPVGRDDARHRLEGPQNEEQGRLAHRGVFSAGGLARIRGQRFLRRYIWWGDYPCVQGSSYRVSIG